MPVEADAALWATQRRVLDIIYNACSAHPVVSFSEKYASYHFLSLFVANYEVVLYDLVEYDFGSDKPDSSFRSSRFQAADDPQQKSGTDGGRQGDGGGGENAPRENVRTNDLLCYVGSLFY